MAWEMTDGVKKDRVVFSISLNPGEQQDLINLTELLGIEKRKHGAKKDTLSKALKLSIKRLEEIRIKAKMFADEEKEFIARQWGLIN